MPQPYFISKWYIHKHELTLLSMPKSLFQQKGHHELVDNGST